MKYLSEYRDPAMARGLVQRILDTATKRWAIGVRSRSLEGFVARADFAPATGDAAGKGHDHVGQRVDRFDRAAC